MIISEHFWEVRFVDFIPLIIAIVSPILIYWIYKKLDKYKEKAKLKAIFIRIKRMLENYLPEKKERKERDFFEAHLPFLRTQGEHLIKIGITIGHTSDRDIKGKIVSSKSTSKEIFNIDIKSKSRIPTLYIVDKYILGGVTIQVIGKKFEINQDNINIILKEMRQYSKKYYGFKFKEKDTTINYKHPFKKSFGFIRHKLIRTNKKQKNKVIT